MLRLVSLLLALLLLSSPEVAVSSPLSFATPLPASAELPLAPVYSWWAGSPEVLLGAVAVNPRRLKGDYEPVDLLLLVHDEDWERSLRTIIKHAQGRAQVEVLMVADTPSPTFRRWAERHAARIRPIPHDTPWIRDYGPFQLFDNGVPFWVDYGYAEDRALDDAVPWELAYDHDTDIAIEADYLEGGAVVSNGRGLCAMSDRSLLETGLPLDDMSTVEGFVTQLGCRALAVLPALPYEQTGHADVTLQFLGPNTVAVASMDPVEFPTEARLLDHAAKVLQRGAKVLRQRLEVVRVPMHADGDIYYSYLNGTRVGDAFFVPSYTGVPAATQRHAYKLLRKALPTVQLVPVEAQLMVELGGAIHCITLGLRLPSPNRELVPDEPAPTRNAKARRRPASPDRPHKSA